MSEARPIGVLDSGVGGLSVLRELRSHLPQEDFIYVADSGYCPYGERSTEFVQQRVLSIADFLIQRGCKALVLACNTATAAAVSKLREHCGQPVVGMEPGIKPAVEMSQRGVVGVLTTVQTARSERLERLVERWAGGVRVLTQSCPGLVDRVEAGDLDSAATRALLQHYVQPLQEAGADVLVLGCTHYPFLQKTLRAIVGDGVTILDTGPAVARQTRRVLEEAALLEAGRGQVEFYSSGDLQHAAPVMQRLWGAPTPLLPLNC